MEDSGVHHRSLEEGEPACSAEDSGVGVPPPAAALSGAIAAATKGSVRYGINDVPPWWLCLLLGMQTFLTMLGSTVLIPLLLVPAMGGDTEDTADVICTCFFASGINTLLQTLLGARLPIVQGGSFAYISPVLAVAAQIQASGQVFDSEHARFIYTMRVLQGGIIGSALIALGLALCGAFLWLLKHLSPLTIGVNISILGLSLYANGWPTMGTCIQLGLPVMVLIIVFAFHMRRVTIFKFPLFGLFPVLLGLGLTWLYAYIMTVSGVYDNASPETQKSCTTDQANFGNIMTTAPWFRVPYPGQWGAPIFTASCVFTMVAAVIPAALESIGDYYAAARLSGAPRPPSEVISRALAVESLCCCVAGLFGTTSGSTAYAENVGAIAVTGVASRRVVQTGAVLMIGISVIGKFGALFASIPQALVAGVFAVMFALIAGVGFTNLEGVNLRNERNIFILGFGLYTGLSVPDYFNSYTAANGHGPVNTGSDPVNSILNSIFATPAAVALMACCLLDWTVPVAADEPREAWQQQSTDDGAWWQDAELCQIYGWPFGLTPKWRAFIDPRRAAAGAVMRRWGAALAARLRCAGRPPRGSEHAGSSAATELSKACSEDAAVGSLPLATVPAPAAARADA